MANDDMMPYFRVSELTCSFYECFEQIDINLRKYDDFNDDDDDGDNDRDDDNDNYDEDD